MVNLFKSHLTVLRKVRNCFYGWTTTMNGLAINSVMTKDDCKKMTRARSYINKAIEILEKANQL